VLTGNNPPPPHNHGVPSSPKLLGVLTGNTDATGSTETPLQRRPHRPAAQPPHQAERRGLIFITHHGRSPPIAARGVRTGGSSYSCLRTAQVSASLT
jgi:hypothetical protein